MSGRTSGLNYKYAVLHPPPLPRRYVGRDCLKQSAVAHSPALQQPVFQQHVPQQAVRRKRVLQQPRESPPAARDLASTHRTWSASLAQLFAWLPPFHDVRHTKRRRISGGFTSIDTLRSILGLEFPGQELEDAVLVALDTEFHSFGGAQHVSEVGLSILDTRELINVKPGRLAELWKEKIRHHHFLVGRTEPRDRPVKSRKQFFFGSSTSMSAAALRRTIIRTIASAVRRHTGKPRSKEPLSVILVGHGIESDVRSLHLCPKLRLDVLEPKTMGITFDDVFDTYHFSFLAERRGAVVPHRKLGQLVQWLGQRDVKGLHNAGNDAAYTMIAVLLFAVRWPELAERGQKSLGRNGSRSPDNSYGTLALRTSSEDQPPVVSPHREMTRWLHRIAENINYYIAKVF